MYGLCLEEVLECVGMLLLLCSLEVEVVCWGLE